MIPYCYNANIYKAFCTVARDFAFAVILFFAQQGYTQTLDFKKLALPIPLSARFSEDNYFIWGTSVISSPQDGKYHMFYARWPKDEGWEAWRTHAEIAHAVGESLFGRFSFVDVVVPYKIDAQGVGVSVYNPVVYRFGEKYYLYYTANTNNTEAINLAVAEDVSGLWKHLDSPIEGTLADIGAQNALSRNRYNIFQLETGKYIMIYQPEPYKRSVSYRYAMADRPEGPFKDITTLYFSAKAKLSAETPYISKQKDKYYMFIKTVIANRHPATVALFVSKDAFRWKYVKNYPLASPMPIKWIDGSVQKNVETLERPQIFMEDGMPKAMVFTVRTRFDNVVNTFCVRLPLGEPEDADEDKTSRRILNATKDVLLKIAEALVESILWTLLLTLASW